MMIGPRLDARLFRTADVYFDSNNNGILDHVQSYQSVADPSGGMSYIPTSGIHDPNVVDSVGDFWDVAKDALEKVFGNCPCNTQIYFSKLTLFLDLF